MAKPKKTAASTTTSGASNRLYLILGAVALVIVIFAITRMGGGGSPVTAPVDLTAEEADVQRARGVALGAEDAPVQLYEFADFQCPACMQFSAFAHPLIKERLIDRGLVRLVRYDFPLINIHPHAFLAARAARCAGDQGRYWEYHDVLYGRQPTWSAVRNASDSFVEYAGLVGLDQSAFTSCLNSDRHADEVTRNLLLGESLGVNGTPSFMLNGQRMTFADYQELEQQVYRMAGIDQASGAAGDASAATDTAAGS